MQTMGHVNPSRGSSKPMTQSPPSIVSLPAEPEFPPELAPWENVDLEHKLLTTARERLVYGAQFDWAHDCSGPSTDLG